MTRFVLDLVIVGWKATDCTARRIALKAVGWSLAAVTAVVLFGIPHWPWESV